MSTALYTIGHSDHDEAAFLDLLARHRIDALADVRSQPYSSHHPQFQKARLQAFLGAAGVAYAFLGRELGARSRDEGCYVNGRADYARIAATDGFRAGLERVRKGAASYRLALLCAEHDPITCHRAILVCRHLRGDGLDIRHVLATGDVETHEALEGRLMRQFDLQDGDLFTPFERRLDRAYELQGERIAYRRPHEGATR